MMKQEVSFDLTVELGPKHRSGISAIHSRADGWGDAAMCDDAAEAFLPGAFGDTSWPRQQRPEEKHEPYSTRFML